ncbi:MAG: arsenite methyltransferase [Planctomycetota bacterium]
MTRTSGDDVREKVRAGYAEIARSGQWSGVAPAATGLTVGASESESAGGCCGGGSGEPGESGGGGCCGPTTLTADQVALAVGYASEDLTVLPAGSNMGLSCGNPTALASLSPGEVVLDLGSGGGFDCFIAGPKVGAAGRVIGVDMTLDMLGKARGNLAGYREQSGLDNVEFRLGEIEHLPVADASVDVVISNCVINLSPDKRQVWREIARVLKPCGRVAVSDLALRKPLPEGVREDVEALVGCVAGADLVDDVRSAVLDAGLGGLEMTAKPQYVDAMTSAEDPLYRRVSAALPEDAKVSDYVVSLDVAARLV